MCTSGRLVRNIDYLFVFQYGNTRSTSSYVNNRTVSHLKQFIGCCRFIKHIAQFKPGCHYYISYSPRIQFVSSRRNCRCRIYKFGFKLLFYLFFKLFDYLYRSYIVHHHAVSYHIRILVSSGYRFEFLIQYGYNYTGGSKIHAGIKYF